MCFVELFFVQEKGRLRTPGLFVNNVDLAHAVSPRSPASQCPGKEVYSVHFLRTLLDKGQAVRKQNLRAVFSHINNSSGNSYILVQQRIRCFCKFVLAIQVLLFAFIGTVDIKVSISRSSGSLS